MDVRKREVTAGEMTVGEVTAGARRASRNGATEERRRRGDLGAES